MQYVLSIENYLKIEKAEIPLEPGVVGLVGENAQGKTTIIGALQELLAGKNDFTKIRNGADRAVIRLDAMEDGEVVSSVQRVQTEGSSRLEAKGLRIGHTATTFLSSVLSEMAINPISLINNNPVEYLKKHLDVTIDPNDYPECAKELVKQVPEKVGGFNAAELVAKKLEEERLFTRKSLEAAEVVLRDFRSGMPAAKPNPPPFTVEELQNEKESIAKKRTQVAVLTERKTMAFKEYSSAFEQMKRVALELEQATIEEGKLKERLAAIGALKESKSKSWQEMNEKQAQLKTLHDELLIPTTDELDAEIRYVDQRQKELEHFNLLCQRFETLAKREEEIKRYAEKFDQLDRDVKFIKYEIPKTLLQRCDLGVEGIEIRDGFLFVGGFPIERLSTAERAVATVKIAIAIAKRKGQVAVCLDGVESLDESHRAEFLKAAQEAGVCVIYTRTGKPDMPFEKEVKNGMILN
jgi:hypothetical protein